MSSSSIIKTEYISDVVILNFLLEDLKDIPCIHLEKMHFSIKLLKCGFFFSFFFGDKYITFWYDVCFANTKGVKDRKCLN